MFSELLQDRMSAETQLTNSMQQSGIQQLLPDIATLSLLHRTPQGINVHHSHPASMHSSSGGESLSYFLS